MKCVAQREGAYSELSILHHSFCCLRQGTVALLYIVIDLSCWKGRLAAQNKSTQFSESRKDYASECILWKRVHDSENKSVMRCPPHTHTHTHSHAWIPPPSHHIWSEIAIVFLCNRHPGTGGGRHMYCACSGKGLFDMFRSGTVKIPCTWFNSWLA